MKQNIITKPKKKLTKVDTEMLDAADKIHKNLIDGVCKNLYVHQLNGENDVVKRLDEKGYIAKIPHPTRRGIAFEWLHGELRPYQVFMKQQIMKSKERFLIVVMATGTGKTKTALALINDYQRTLIVTPRINLSAQTHSVFGESLEVGLLQGQNSKNLSAPHIVANLQTLERRLEKATDSLVDFPEFDLVIWDECHYSYERIKKLIPKLSGKHVGLTATAYHADGTPLDGAKIIEPFDIQYFIDRKYLAPLKCFQTVLVSAINYRERAISFKKSSKSNK